MSSRAWLFHTMRVSTLMSPPQRGLPGLLSLKSSLWHSLLHLHHLVPLFGQRSSLFENLIHLFVYLYHPPTRMCTQWEEGLCYEDSIQDVLGTQNLFNKWIKSVCLAIEEIEIWIIGWWGWRIHIKDTLSSLPWQRLLNISHCPSSLPLVIELPNFS